MRIAAMPDRDGAITEGLADYGVETERCWVDRARVSSDRQGGRGQPGRPPATTRETACADTPAAAATSAGVAERVPGRLRGRRADG